MSGIYQQGPSDVQRDTTLRDLLGVVFRRKWIIITVFAVASAVVGVRTASTPVTFSADATLLLNRAGARASLMSNYGRVLPWVEVVESELEVLRSTPVLAGASERLAAGLDSPEDTLSIRPGVIGRSISVGVVGESNVIYVTASADSRRDAILIANAVAYSYVDYHDEFFRLPDPRHSMQASADSIYAALTRLESHRSELFSDIGVTNFVEEERLLGGRRQSLANELGKLDRDYAILTTQIEDAKNFLESDAETLPFLETTATIQAAGIRDNAQNLAFKRRELEAARQKYTAIHPKVAALVQDVELLTREVEVGVSQLIDTKSHELRANRSEAQVIDRQLKAIAARESMLPRVKSEIELLTTQIKSAQRQYETLAENLVDADISSESYQEYSVQLLSPANSAQRSAKGDMVRIALVPLLALMGGIGLAFYLENLDHSVGSREDVERHLEIPVLASFPDADVGTGDSSGDKPPRDVPFRSKQRRIS